MRDSSADKLREILRKIDRQANLALGGSHIEQEIALKYCRDVSRDVLKSTEQQQNPQITSSD